MTENSISKKLEFYKCFLACDRNFVDGKKPLNRKVDFNDNLIEYRDACNYIEKGQNIGLVLGFGLIAIDIDDPESISKIKEFCTSTYEEITPSGGVHLIYKFNGFFDNCNLILSEKHIGEIRTNRQYIVIYPSKAKSKTDGKFKPYKIINDVEPVFINENTLNKLKYMFSSKNNCFSRIESSPKTTGGGVSKGIDRSRYDFAKVCELIENGNQSFDEVCKHMKLFGSSKWNERGLLYQKMTYRSACMRTGSKK